MNINPLNTITVVFAFLVSNLSAQSIRKDYREFTSQEMTDYRSAINTMRTNGQWMTLANDHSSHFTSPIHTTGSQTGEQFLSWHRFFLLEFEWHLRNSNGITSSYLSLPYWDWRTDRASTSATHWNNQFLALNNLSGFVGGTVSLTRAITNTNGSNLPTTANIDACLNLSSFWANTTNKSPTSSDFSHRLEIFHDVTHNWVGGSMGQLNSPRDPIFYLHHNMVDFIWQMWEDRNSGMQSSFPNSGTTPMVHYGTPEYPFNVISNGMRDSRAITNPRNSSLGRTNDVWFAFNQKVLLDGANGTDFVCNRTDQPYLYRYTAATTTGGTSVVGSIHVGDVQRDASDNVIPDNKGGFRIEANVTTDFRAGRDVHFKPGFWAKAGSKVSAKIITVPNGFRKASVEEEEAQNLKYTIFPNPSQGSIQLDVSLPEVSDLKITIVDLMGRVVQEIIKNNHDKGTYSFDIDLSDQVNGIYICSILHNGQVYTNRIVIQK